MDTSVLSFAPEREVEHVEYETRGPDGTWRGSANEMGRDAIQPSAGFAWMVRENHTYSRVVPGASRLMIFCYYIYLMPLTCSTMRRDPPRSRCIFDCNRRQCLARN